MHRTTNARDDHVMSTTRAEIVQLRTEIATLEEHLAGLYTRRAAIIAEQARTTSHRQIAAGWLISQPRVTGILQKHSGATRRTRAVRSGE